MGKETPDGVINGRDGAWLYGPFADSSVNIEPEDGIETDALSSATEALAERMEYELLGAWRAGYDWLHVYEELPLSNVGLSHDPLEDALTITQYVYPSDSERPRLLEHDDVVYRHSYDLSSVPDDVIRQAVRGDLENVEHDA